jgi:hypothetical protein
MSSVYFYVHEDPSEQREAMFEKIQNVLYRNVRKSQIPTPPH